MYYWRRFEELPENGNVFVSQELRFHYSHASRPPTHERRAEPISGDAFIHTMLSLATTCPPPKSTQSNSFSYMCWLLWTKHWYWNESIHVWEWNSENCRWFMLMMNNGIAKPWTNEHTIISVGNVICFMLSWQQLSSFQSICSSPMWTKIDNSMFTNHKPKKELHSVKCGTIYIW